MSFSNYCGHHVSSGIVRECPDMTQDAAASFAVRWIRRESLSESPIVMYKYGSVRIASLCSTAPLQVQGLNAQGVFCDVIGAEHERVQSYLPAIELTPCAGAPHSVHS